MYAGVVLTMGPKSLRPIVKIFLFFYYLKKKYILYYWHKDLSENMKVVCPSDICTKSSYDHLFN